MHRFFIFPPDKIVDEKVLITSDELLHQFVDVLRFKVGEQVVILDNSGYEYLTEISEISKNSVRGNVLKKYLNGAESETKICLYMALMKQQEKFEFVLQKATETGVSEFVPIITKRTERESLNKIERLNRILKEAAEQSGRGVIPVLREPVKLEKILKEKNDEGKSVLNLFAHTGGENFSRSLSGFSKVNIFIGPEGGFDDGEVEMAKKAGFLVAAFGKTVLRAETAGIVIPAIIREFI